MFPEHHWMDYPDALKEEIQCILLPQPMPAAPVHQVAQLAPVIAQATIQPPTALPLLKVSQPPPTATIAADSANGCSNPTGSQQVCAGFRSSRPTFSETWTL
uniref:Uncharacterized protein n=1 Tax=Romanomermis culicivorax TaxID=13658 RepID=A0A915HQZ8_ROMCU